ncbi:hypothetical protein MNO14_15450 [Luteimonas sp. S4-F44]|uniref:hypothetical protein n=1 Tax=Luteimonas sp. S4-F44 TaxID=2925842 RepID=UPI001F52EE20|nr:hypothetical protein [Luteimonas sp. S4-F44]UNK42310.1 hypothetical protein MNO14_15450 [Luteimonas sp. S4-F44]
MSLRALLAEVHPAWHEAGDGGLDPALLRRACDSALGRRLLASSLAAGPASHLLAPSPDGPGALITRWSRARLDALHRDLGVLAYAPAIRAEIGREPVRRLKAALGSSYLLALDRSVWDAKVEPETQARLAESLRHALSATDGATTLLRTFSHQGRAELQAWASHRDPALAQWARLLEAPETLPPAHLPEKPVLVVQTHHQNRAVAA